MLGIGLKILNWGLGKTAWGRSGSDGVLKVIDGCCPGLNGSGVRMGVEGGEDDDLAWSSGSGLRSQATVHRGERGGGRRLVEICGRVGVG